MSTVQAVVQGQINQTYDQLFQATFGKPARRARKSFKAFVGAGATHEELKPKSGSGYSRYSYDGQYVTYYA